MYNQRQKEQLINLQREICSNFNKSKRKKKSASKELMGEFQAEGEKIEKSKTEHSKINVKREQKVLINLK